MSSSDHETLRADVAGHALATLEPEERARFEAHPAGCATCRAELARLAPAAALVAEAGRPLPADLAGLREWTLHAVERAAGAVEPAPASDNGAFTAEPSPAVAPGLRRRRSRRPSRSHGPPFALAAAAVAAVLAVLVVGRGLRAQTCRAEIPARSRRSRASRRPAVTRRRSSTSTSPASAASSTSTRTTCRSSPSAGTTSCGSSARATGRVPRTASRPAPSTPTRTGGPR